MNNKATITLRDIETCQIITTASIEYEGKRIKYEYENGKYHFYLEGKSRTIFISADNFVSKIYRFSKNKSVDISLIKSGPSGYLKKINIFPGNTLRLAVSSNVKYKITIFRLGIEKRELISTKWHQAINQKIPDGDIVENGLGWKTTNKIAIPKNASPGLYSLEIRSNKKKFDLPFIIESKNDKNKILVLANDTTWHCYNCWGGRSKYRNFRYSNKVPNRKKKLVKLKMFLSNLLNIPFFKSIYFIYKRFKNQPKLNPWMHKKITTQRPLYNNDINSNNVSKPFCDHLAAAEWRLNAWLEREDYRYDYVAASQLEKKDLRNYKCIILSSHCEYWSREMYENLKKANKLFKVAIMNLGGNSINGCIEIIENGIRYLGPFKDEVECESIFLGSKTTDVDYSTCAPYKVIEKDHWIWESTLISKEFGNYSLIQKMPKIMQYSPGKPSGGEDFLKGNGASGWETDKRTSETPHHFKLIAKGLNRFGGGDILISEEEGTIGSILNVSSITFGASLLIDYGLSKMIKNFLDRIK